MTVPSRMLGLRSKLITTIFALFCTLGTLPGQNAKEMGDLALNEKVTELVKQNEFLAARPFLLEMKERLKEQPENDILEAVSFFIASSYLEEYQINKKPESLKIAVKGFEEYVAKFPIGPRKIIALLNLGDAYSDLKQYDKAIQTYSAIYNDPRTDGAVRNDIRRVIAQTYLKTDKPEEGMPYFMEAYNLAVLNDEARAEAATWLLQAYLSKGELDAILPYFNNLTGRNAALFNPKFNVTLIKAGDQLFENGDYDFAILFYAIVKKKQDIVAFYEEAVRELKLALTYRDKSSEEGIAFEKRLREAEANLKAVRGIREYDADVRWRSARVLLESERTWEALWSFYNLMLDYPKHEKAEEFLFLAFSQARKINDFVMIEQLANDYLAQATYKKYRGQVTLDLATYYKDRGMDEKFYALTTQYLDNNPEQDKIASQLSNLLAIYLMDRELFAELQQRMEGYKQAHQQLRSTRESAHYWNALALTIAADYERALEAFNTFIEQYGMNSIFSEDAYYRQAICLFGVQQVDDAYNKFTEFVQTFPTSKRRGEAELYLGDIRRERGQIKEALEHYQQVEQYTDRMSFITKATFAISEVLDADGKDDLSAQTLLTYIERYGQLADLGEAYLRLGQYEMRRNNIAGRFQYYALGLEATANDPKRYAADAILIEYVTDYPMFIAYYQAAIRLIDAMLDDSDYRNRILRDRAARYQFFQSEEGMKVDPILSQKIIRDRIFRKKLEDDPETILVGLRSDYTKKLDALAAYQPEKIFSKLLAATSEPKTVLELRLAMGREMLTGTELMFPYSQEQIESASPAVMLWRAKKLRTTNPALAKSLLETSLEKHPYEPKRYDTMLELAEIEMASARARPSVEAWNSALSQYQLMIERFGMRAEKGTPYLAKGEILIQLDQAETALPILNDILRNPEWRGQPHAKAHLLLGQAYYKLQQFAEAHGFFERLMLGFGGFKDEVALAYYWDIKTLESMNQTESMNQLLTELRTREDLKGTEGYRLIEENYAL